MKSSKYILMLFIAIYISACLLSPFMDISGLEIRRSYIYAALVIPSYILLIIGDFVLNKIAQLRGAESWLNIYERPLHEEKRIYGLDVIRFFAIIFVPSIHFMGLTGFYSAKLNGAEMFFATCTRWIFICCVPLFLTITGYFKHTKGITFSHYKSIFAVLATHIFITSIRLAVDFKYHGIELTREYVLDKLVYFEYGWYVKLYIGIMLLVPFFNLIWSSLKTRLNKELLILTLILLCSMGPLTYGIIPSSWVIIYVFIYYFIGAYLYEYKVYINKWLNLLLIAGLLLLTALGNFTNTMADGSFNWDFAAYGSNSGYSSLPAVMLTFLIMTLLIDVDTGIKPLRGFFYSFSVVSLEMYMLSQMFDGIIYPKLNYSEFTDIFPYMPIVVGSIVILSYISAQIKRLIFYVVMLPFKFICGKK